MHRCNGSQLIGFALAVAAAGCATEANEPVTTVTANNVIETLDTGDGLSTTVYDRDRRHALASFERANDTGLTRVEQPPRASKTLDTGIPVALDDLGSYNESVAATFERSLRIQAGTVAYGECGSGWNEYVIPDGWWGHCCTAHDSCYGRGGNEDARRRCDDELRSCMNRVWAPGDAYYGAVRTFGGNWFSYWHDDGNGGGWGS